ncbi:MAG TPA: type II/IV secretion system protein [Planctomycetaceae bacterium]|nr:type II/IV secretion system protein [Planctomycetaceae bacterium]
MFNWSTLWTTPHRPCSDRTILPDDCVDVKHNISTALESLDATCVEYADQFVQQLVREAERCRASDVHLQPRPEGIEVHWRIDGVIQRLGLFPRGEQSQAIVRLKVMAGLLTYRTDVPQEGRIRDFLTTEMRLATYPTVFGERAVVRLFAAAGQLCQLGDLGFPTDVQETLEADLTAPSGAVVISGPAGTGKTTTAYACLRKLHHRTVLTIEDPVESLVDGAVQSQTDDKSGFDLASGIRAMMRQDPEVILIGEVRDPETARGAFSAALTGHLLLTTIHAGKASEATFRLIDMGIEAHTLRATLLSVLGQRLVRRLCQCARSASGDERLGLDGSDAMVPVGCDKCQHSGYLGRALLVEYFNARNPSVRSVIQNANTSHEIEQRAVSEGMVTLRQRGLEAVTAGVTSPQEWRRVLGDP